MTEKTRFTESPTVRINKESVKTETKDIFRNWNLATLHFTMEVPLRRNGRLKWSTTLSNFRKKMRTSKMIFAEQKYKARFSKRSHHKKRLVLKQQRHLI